MNLFLATLQLEKFKVEGPASGNDLGVESFFSKKQNEVP